MKKQRPTIPISEWKLATNLESTREIQNQEGTPAHKCQCEWCVSWKACYKEILTEKLIEQLLRVGIQLENPTDLYEFKSNNEGSSIRVVYHAVGKLLSGPNQWQNNELGKSLMYLPIRQAPYLSLVVYPQSQSHDQSPVLKDNANGELIRIDFRLQIPKSYINSNKAVKNA